MKREILLDIVCSGVMAPSADNQHVFEVELLDSSILLWPTSEFTEYTPKHRRVLSLMSLGAVVENMKLRGSELGISVRPVWFPKGKGGPIAQLDLQLAPGATVDLLAAAIPMRHTNRRMYKGPELLESETRLIEEAIAQADGVSLVWLQGTARRHALSLIWQAESERFLRQQLHKEIFSAIRFDLSWEETADWALPPGALEIERPMRPIFKALRHWDFMRRLNWFGVHRLVGLRAGWLPCWQAPALGLLVTAEEDAEKGSIAVGAAFERLWLRATILKLALQPMAASAVLPLQSTEDRGASDKVRSALMAGWKKIAPSGMPLMLFRLGRANPPSMVSGRRMHEQYLVRTRQ